MPIINGRILEADKDLAWFGANPAFILLKGEIVFLEGTTQFKKGDGVTQLQNLVFSANDHFKGKFISLAALQTAYPTASDGDYAVVDTGVGSDADQYIWDTEEGWVLGSGSGGVASFNGRIGAVVPLAGDYDSTDIDTPAVGNLTTTNVGGQLAEIADIIANILDDRGSYDASVGTFPAAGGSGVAGAIKKGDAWNISVAGTMGAVAYIKGDVVYALVDTPGQTAGNWNKIPNVFGYVPQPENANLTAISGITFADNDILQRKAGALVNRTLAQLAADLSATLVKATITNGVTDSAPSQDAVFDALALKITGTTTTAHTQQSKADSARYYFGKFYSLAPSVAAGVRKYKFEKNVTIIGVRVSVSAVVQATSELSTISIRLNNTTSFQLIQIDYSLVPANGSYAFSANNLSIAVLSTDECETTEDTPAWVTNPTNTFMTVDLITA